MNRTCHFINGGSLEILLTIFICGVKDCKFWSYHVQIKSTLHHLFSFVFNKLWFQNFLKNWKIVISFFKIKYLRIFAVKCFFRNGNVILIIWGSFCTANTNYECQQKSSLWNIFSVLRATWLVSTLQKNFV